MDLLYNTGMDPRSNIILIGMPGSGKSTVGRILADLLGWALVDTDKLIEERRHKQLQAILDQDGIGAFIRLELRSCALWILSTMSFHRGLWSSTSSQQHLRRLGFVVYLDVTYTKIERGSGNIKTRGIVIKMHSRSGISTA
jgi:shikimate kinase